MIDRLEKLLDEWKNRKSWMMAYAEEAFFANDDEKEHHFKTCIRQWNNAVKELENIIQEELLSELTNDL